MTVTKTGRCTRCSRPLTRPGRWVRFVAALGACPLPSSLFPLPLLALGACREAFTTDVTIVARANGAELTVDRLAEMFAQGKALAMERTVVERVARLWVDYSLFAQRIIAGDSLLDSATVVTALWTGVQQRIADHFHEGMVSRLAKLDSAKIDSVYAAGDFRLLQHILVRTEPSIAPPERDARRERAARIQARLANGGSWAEANRSNDDTRSRDQAGSLGILTRGETPAAFERAAFALQPGEISAVVETPQGFHIIRRPPLREQRAAFTAGVEDRVIGQMDSAYLAGLAERRHVRVKSDAPAMVRSALANPDASADSRAVLGTFDGGKLTVGDLLRWVSALSPEVQQQVPRADDQQMVEFIRSLMRNQALMVEADSAGVRLTALDLQEFREVFRRELAKVREALALDDAKLGDTTRSTIERQRLAALHVETYLEGLANNRMQFVGVPPFLATRLREQADWSISSAGVNRVLERAGQLRAVIDSMRPPPKTTTDSGANDDR